VTLISTAGTAIRAACTSSARCPRRAARLSDITYEALLRGVAAVRPGGRTNDIGAAIQALAERERCSVVRDFCGHGLGRVFPRRADDPPLRRAFLQRRAQARHAVHRGADDQRRRAHVKVLADGWTAVTRDRSLSAQFEHTVGVTESGVEVFTRSPKGYDKPPYDIAR
jgi:methionyl aminopeptidase